MSEAGPMTEEMPLRITIIEAAHGISTVGSLTLGAAIIAALGTFPRTIEALLRATEGIFWGASRRIMADLIAHDRKELLWRQGYRPPPGRLPESDTWAVTDTISYTLAQCPASGGLLFIDLERRLVSTLPPAPPPLLMGKVAVFNGERFLPNTVTYDLRGGWDKMR
jgi:hypothetical protein